MSTKHSKAAAEFLKNKKQADGMTKHFGWLGQSVTD